jgi:hypothetical protein
MAESTLMKNAWLSAAMAWRERKMFKADSIWKRGARGRTLASMLLPVPAAAAA